MPRKKNAGNSKHVHPITTDFQNKKVSIFQREKVYDLLKSIIVTFELDSRRFFSRIAWNFSKVLIVYLILISLNGLNRTMKAAPCIHACIQII